MQIEMDDIFKPYDSDYRFQYYLNTNSEMEKRDIFQANIKKKTKMLRFSEVLVILYQD